MDELTAKTNGFIFHHKIYSKSNETSCYESSYYITFDNIGGRFANQLYRYLTCKLFTLNSGHKYISRDMFKNEDFIIVNEDNINEFLSNRNTLLNKNIICQGFFQKSDLFIKQRQQLIDLIFNKDNDDYLQMDGKNYYIKDYLINSKHI